MPEYRYLVVDHTDGICTVTLNRPDVLNAWNEDMRVEMRSVMRDLQADSRMRVLVITGAGRAFSAGEDVGDIKSRQKAKTTSRDFRIIARNIHNFLNELELMEILSSPRSTAWPRPVAWNSRCPATSASQLRARGSGSRRSGSDLFPDREAARGSSRWSAWHAPRNWS